MSSNGAPPEDSRRSTPSAASVPSVRAAEAICSALAGDLARLLDNDPEVRRGVDPEAVHQARVATRRFRSQLRSFESVLRRQESEQLASELKRLADLLGAVRDLDVLRDRFAEAAEPGLALVERTVEASTGADGREWGEGSGGEGAFRYELPVVPVRVVAAVVALVEAERASGFAALTEEMGSKSYEKLLGRLAGFVSSPPFRKSAALPASEVLEPAASSAFAALASAVRRLEPVATDAALHKIRIKAKRARYAAQALPPLGGDGYEVLAKRLAKLQDTLGLLNDGSRATAWLGRLRSTPEVAGHTGEVAQTGSWPVPFLAGVDLLIAREHLKMAAARSSWPEMWRRAAESAEALDWPGYETARSMRASSSSSSRPITSSAAMFSVT